MATDHPRGRRSHIVIGFCWMVVVVLCTVRAANAQVPADTLYHFPPSYRGASGLVQGTDGNLYGTTYDSGAYLGAME